MQRNKIFGFGILHPLAAEPTSPDMTNAATYGGRCVVEIDRRLDSIVAVSVSIGRGGDYALP